MEVFVYSLISAGLHSYMLTLHKWGQLISFWQKTRANSRTFGGSPLLKVFQRELAWPSVNLLGFLFSTQFPLQYWVHIVESHSVFSALILYWRTFLPPESVDERCFQKKCRWAGQFILFIMLASGTHIWYTLKLKRDGIISV